MHANTCAFDSFLRQSRNVVVAANTVIPPNDLRMGVMTSRWGSGRAEDGEVERAGRDGELGIVRGEREVWRRRA